jgi:hypothetical protein
MLQPASLDALVKAQGIALLGIAEWMSERSDVPPPVMKSLLQVLAAIPILVGGDLGPEAESEMRAKANAVAIRITGGPIL